jgi:hypothetical protein
MHQVDHAGLRDDVRVGHIGILAQASGGRASASLTSSRSAITTRAPHWASTRAMARPSPDAPPVTSTTRPRTSNTVARTAPGSAVIANPPGPRRGWVCPAGASDGLGGREPSGNRHAPRDLRTAAMQSWWLPFLTSRPRRVVGENLTIVNNIASAIAASGAELDGRRTIDRAGRRPRRARRQPRPHRTASTAPLPAVKITAGVGGRDHGRSHRRRRPACVPLSLRMARLTGTASASGRKNVHNLVAGAVRMLS